VTIYGDGRALVHYPRYMKRAGDYMVRLAQPELDGLLRSLVDRGVAGFDEAAARRGKRDAEAARRTSQATGGGQTVTVAADTSTTVIELRLEGVQRRIAWQGLREDARRYPEITSIQDLAAAEGELRALMERPDLEKLP
jgi:hypothetical protein